MTILSVCQDVAVELSESVPTTLFNVTPSVFVRELRLHARRAAEDLAEGYDWQALTKLGTVTGDGAAASFNLPPDYARMPKKARLHSEDHNLDFTQANDLDHWLWLKDRVGPTSPGTWLLMGGMLQIWPVLASGRTARFYYQSNNLVIQTSGLSSTFANDSDQFVLSENLLALGIVWRWRAAKRVDYSTELDNYNLAVGRHITRDHGPRILTVGRQRMPGNVAYDGVLGNPAGGSSFPGGGWDFSQNTEPTFDET